MSRWIRGTSHGKDIIAPSQNGHIEIETIIDIELLGMGSAIIGNTNVSRNEYHRKQRSQSNHLAFPLDINGIAEIGFAPVRDVKEP